MMTNKKKIINDPVHGFINIPTALIFDIIEHPLFQRLRRIKQLGLADYVYLGAHHTRFHHALGSMHLMGRALEILVDKGFEVSDEEKEAAQIAILLHDVGHGPFSHVLEHHIMPNVSHEALSGLIMKALNQHFGGQLDLAIQMFEGVYARPFFHELISSQLDMDRLDYLQRDSFFTGVLEGTIGAKRILKLMTLVDDRLVFEEKGIYSIENFLTARRLMYWQVYLHKTTTSTEVMLIKILTRARDLIQQGHTLYNPPAFGVFLENNITWEMFGQDPKYLEAFVQIDDHDIWSMIKAWMLSEDTTLSTLCRMVLDRKLFKLRLSDNPPDPKEIEQIHNELRSRLDVDDISFFWDQGSTQNEAYQLKTSQILIKTKNKGILNIAEASDLANIKALSKIVKKYYICWAQ